MDLRYLQENSDVVWDKTIEHLMLSLTALAIALPLAIVLGVMATRFRWLTTPIVSMVSILYTVPSFAFMAFLIPEFGIGRTPALIVLVTYAQLFLVRNIVAGLKSVDPAVLEAARGLGMNEAQLFGKIWLPLAAPVIIAGIRTALLAIIAMATLTGYIRSGGLGEIMFSGIGRDYPSQVLAGVIAVAALAIVTDLALRAIEMITPVARARRAT
jgi:osmoprotectant transport system permease protein